MYGHYPDGPFITGEMAAGMARMMTERAAVDPLFAEDCESVRESMPYVVQMHEGTRPIRCECCGTLVTMVPEAEPCEPPWTFRAAIWEADTARKHTLRRCTWRRDHGSPAPPPVPLEF